MSRAAALFALATALVGAGLAAPTISGVRDTFSNSNQLCPGVLATIYGANFGTDAAQARVTVGGKTAFVLSGEYYSPTQMAIQIPFAVATGPASVTVAISGISSSAFDITISAVSPYFQSLDGSGSGPIVAYQADSTIPITLATPAHAGDAVSAVVSGLGVTNPATPDTDDGIAPAAAPVSPLPTVTIGGVSAPVRFAGVARGQYSGFYELNFTVPAGVAPGPQKIVVTMNGVESTSVGVNNAVETLPIASTAAPPTISGVQNGNFGATLCPGMEAIVYGWGFGADASKVSFTVDGKPGYVFPGKYVASDQMLVQIPFEAAAGATNMVVTVDGVPSAPFRVSLAATAPAWVIQGDAISGAAAVFEAGSDLPIGLIPPPGFSTVVQASVGDTLYAYAIGLGPTNPGSPTGLQSTANPTATTPAVTLGGIAATNVSAVLTNSSVALYKVSFTVPAGVQGTVPLVISIGGNRSVSTSVTIAVNGLSAVTNNASFANPGTASPGSIVTAFANGLGTHTDAISGVFPKVLSEGVQVAFTGGAANAEGGPIFHVLASPPQQQVDLLVPTDLPTSGTVSVQLSTSTAQYATYTLKMVPANPGLYRIADPSQGNRSNVIAQFNGTTWLAMPASMTAALGLPACAKFTGALAQCGQPATAGDVLALYVTGLGLATPGGDPGGKPLRTGEVAPLSGSPLYQTPATPAITIGGVPVSQIYFSGIAPGYAGLYQIDLVVPPGIASGDDVPVVVSMAGQSDTATISIQAR